MIASIRADGMDWPVETYLDALGFKRVDPFDRPRLEVGVRVVTLTTAARVTPPLFAEQVDWYETVAYRFIDHGLESTPCRCCGEPSGRADLHDICQSCEDENEPWF